MHYFVGRRYVAIQSCGDSRPLLVGLPKRERWGAPAAAVKRLAASSSSLGMRTPPFSRECHRLSKKTRCYRPGFSFGFTPARKTRRAFQQRGSLCQLRPPKPDDIDICLTILGVAAFKTVRGACNTAGLPAWCNRNVVKSSGADSEDDCVRRLSRS